MRVFVADRTTISLVERSALEEKLASSESTNVGLTLATRELGPADASHTVLGAPTASVL